MLPRLLASVALSACSIANATIIALPGSSPQHSTAGSYFPNPLSFKVTDDSGAPVAGATVTMLTANSMYAEPGPNCEPAPFSAPYSYCSGLTQADGTIAFPRLREEYAGTYQVPVKAVLGQRDLGNVTLMFTVDPKSTPATLTLVSGSSQTTVQMGYFAPLVFKLTREGTPIPNAMIVVQAAIQGPDVPVPGNPGNGGTSLYTDANGQAQGTIRADGAVGAGVLTATYVDNVARAVVTTSTTYTVTNTRGGFDLSLQGLWWGGISENGWGLSLVQHRHQLFNVLFAYDDGGNPVWYAQPNPRWSNGFGGQLFGQLYSPKGTPWYAYDASKLVVGDPVGSGFVIFESEAKANFSTYFNVSNGSQAGHSASLVPQDFERPGISPITGVGDMWWGGPQQNGWGVAIHEHQGVLFIVWFTYDDNGKPMWLVMPGGDWKDASTYAGKIYRTHSAGWRNGYDASRLTVTAVGTFSLKFASQSQASMTVQVDGRTGTLDLVRQPF